MRGGPLLALFVIASGTLLVPSCKQKDSGGAAAQASGKPARSAPEPVLFRVAPVSVGQKWKESRNSALKISVEFWQDDEKVGNNELFRSEEYERKVEVLGLIGGAPSKVAAHYDRYRLSEARLGQPARQDAHVEGQDYVVDASGSAVAITSGGKAVTSEEEQSLQKLHAGLGSDDPIASGLAARKWAIGAPVRLSRELFEALARTAGEFKEGTITVIATREVEGVRAAEIEWSGEAHTNEEGGLEFDWHLRGKAVLALAPARVLSSTMSGSIDASGESRQGGKKTKMLGAGSITDAYSYSPL